MIAPTKRALRPYQVEAQQAIDRDFFTDGREDCVLSLPPAGGKTFTSVDYARTRFLERGKRVLWVCHTKELVVQAARDFIAQCPRHRITIWKGQEYRDATGDVVVLSVQSYKAFISALERDPSLNRFGLLIIDECHHAAGKTYQSVVEEVNHEKRLGLSGTPKRHDEESFGFSHIAYQKTFRQLYEEGWCARPIYFRYRTGQTHLFAVDKRKGDYTSASLSSLNNAPRNELVARTFLEDRSFWPGLVFCTGVDHVHEIVKTVKYEAKRLGIQCRVESVIGDQSRAAKERRDRVVDAYRRGEVDLLVNCEVFTEGTDLPTVRSIMLARPTASHVKYLQMLLRGGRSFPEYAATGNDPSPGLNPDNVFYIHDFVDSAHHYANASRGWALSELDETQVKKELVKTDDVEEKRQLVEKAGKEAFDKFFTEAKAGKEKQWRGVKYEDDVLTREEWTLCQAAAVLITYNTFEKDPKLAESKRILTGDQDFAVLLGTEWIKNRLVGPWKRSSALERKETIRDAYEMFGKDAFKVGEWTSIMQAYIGHVVFKNKRPDGGVTWMHIVGDGDPPMQEVQDLIDEKEAELAEIDSLVKDVSELWDDIMRALKRRHPSPMWDELDKHIPRDKLRWSNKRLTVHFAAGAFVRQAYWLEAAGEIALQRLLDLPDATLFMDFPIDTGRLCPTCGKGKMLVRYPARGGKFLSCSDYPKCQGTINVPRSKESLSQLIHAMRVQLPPPRTR